MRKIAFAAAVVALGMGMLPMAAFAQANVTQAQVVAACTVANNAAQCSQLIANYVAKFPAGSKQVQQAIADLVVALATSPAASGNATLKAAVSAAISEVAALSPNPEQKAQIVAIAATVSAPGEVQTAAIIVTRPASDN